MPQAKSVVRTVKIVQIDEQMLNMVNEERVKVGVEPLVLNEKLMITAQERAEDMIERNYWSHVDPDGEWAWVLMHKIGYLYDHAGENLYRQANIDITTGLWDRHAVRAWMGSPEHRENILDDFNELGIGRAGDIIVHHFGKRV